MLLNEKWTVTRTWISLKSLAIDIKSHKNTLADLTEQWVQLENV